MIHHRTGYSHTMSHQGTWLVSWKTCLLTPLPGFQERVLKRKRLGVVHGKEKEDILGLAPWTPMSQLTSGELSFLYFCPSAPICEVKSR